MILSQTQAETVYAAMCALNNVGGKLTTALPSGAAYLAIVSDPDSEMLGVIEFVEGEQKGYEEYENQASFVAAYGLE